MKIISWHPVLTDHQSYTLEALKNKGGCDLNVNVLKAAHAERESQGWVNRHDASFSPTLMPRKGLIKFAIHRLRENRDAVHIFSSPFEEIKLILVLILAVTFGCRVYLISEPYSSISTGYQSNGKRYTNWLKAKLRPFLYRLYGQLLSRRICGVFAISCLAIEQYQRIGVPRKKIFPFGYFVPHQEADNPRNFPATISKQKLLKLVFIGNLISRKGLDILLRGIEDLNNSGFLFSLDVYGHGDFSQYDVNHASVRYCGLIPFGYSQSVISEYDFLVLPSRYDGWGVVVNEALMAGVPVICSNQVGASAVINKWHCGSVFISEDVSDFVAKLKDISIHLEKRNSMRDAALKAGASLSPEIASQYMFDVINQKPTENGMQKQNECPWYGC